MHRRRESEVRHNQAIIVLSTLSGLITVALILYMGKFAPLF